MKIFLHLFFRFLQIGFFLYLFYEFEISRFSDYQSDGLFIGTNIRSQTIYMFIVGNLFQLVHLFLKYYKLENNRKVHMYIIQLVVSTILCGTSARLLYSNFFGISGNDCDYSEEITIPFQLVEGVCISPEMDDSSNNLVSQAFSMSAIQKIDTSHHASVVSFARSCMAEQFWLIGQTFLMAMTLYQTELLYVNSDMRLELQLHHYAVIALTLIPFYTDFSTVSITITNIQTFFTAFEHPLYIALLYNRLVDDTHLVTKRNLFVFAYYFCLGTKVIAHVGSLYMLFRYEMYTDTVTFWSWLILLHVFGYLQLFPMRAQIRAIRNFNKKVKDYHSK